MNILLDITDDKSAEILFRFLILLHTYAELLVVFEGKSIDLLIIALNAIAEQCAYETLKEELFHWDREK